MWSHPEGAYKDGDGTNNYNTAEDERRSLSILSKELCQNTCPVEGGRGAGYREQEGFSAEETFKRGCRVKKILNSPEGETGTQTQVTA